MPNTRDKLIKLLSQVQYLGGLEDKIADHLIANGVTVQQWIPVTERLPEDDLPKDSNVKQIKVLVAYKTNGRWVERTQLRVKGYWYREPDKRLCQEGASGLLRNEPK